jgi:hypothetical protein
LVGKTSNFQAQVILSHFSFFNSLIPPKEEISSIILLSSPLSAETINHIKDACSLLMEQRKGKREREKEGGRERGREWE